MNATYATQLVYRREDENGDMVFGAGEEGFIEADKAMSQVLKTRLAAGAGEWWEGDDTAIPWFTGVLGSMCREGRKDEIDLLVINRIMDTVNVIGIDDIKSEIVNRQYRFSATVHTVYGDVTAEVNT